MKKLLIIFILIFQAIIFARSDSLFVEITSDIVTFNHYYSFENCGAQYTMDIQKENNHITLTEIDTGASANCMCYFNLSVTIDSIPVGEYTADIFKTIGADHDGYDYMSHDTIFVGSLNFVIEDDDTANFYPQFLTQTNSGCIINKEIFSDGDIGLIDHTNSGCLNGKGDSSYIFLYSYGGNLMFHFHAEELNCCLEPLWTGFLSNDTFHIALSDTGEPCDCLCPFDLSATFGPFESGVYIVDFMDGLYGYPSFIIGSNVSIEVDSNMMTLIWDIAELNCCFEPFWEGWLSADTFYVTVTDTGNPCYCICPFHMTSCFGPFDSGTYVLNFNYCDEFPVFTIADYSQQKSPEIIEMYQSECYDIVDIKQENAIITKFKLHSPYPNPFNAITQIKFSMGKKTSVRLAVFDIRGNLITELLNDEMLAGNHQISWNAHNNPSGIYFIKLFSDAHEFSKKVLLLK